MNVLVTGCAGFIGSHTTELFLSNGHNVTGIDNFDDFYSRTSKEKNISESLKNTKFTFIEGNLLDKKIFENLDSNFDCVIHLAAKAGVRPSIKNPQDYIDHNITCTKNVLDWMNTSGTKNIVFASSSSVYGNNTKVPFSETDNVDYPISPYAFTKKACELLNHTYHHLYKINIINLRLFTVYGPRQRPDLAIRKFVDRMRNNAPITLFGDGQTGRDYTYISDITLGFYNAVNYLVNNKNVFETINLGNSNPVKLIDLVNCLYDLLNAEKKIEYTSMQDGDVNLTFANIEKAKQFLNYHPKTSLKEGLTNFIKWYESNS